MTDIDDKALDALCDELRNTGDDWPACLVVLETKAADTITTLRARLREVEAERDEAQSIVKDTLWMARRYADGRNTYAPNMYNRAARLAVNAGIVTKSDKESLWAADPLGAQSSGLSDEEYADAVSCRSVFEQLRAEGRCRAEAAEAREAKLREALEAGRRKLATYAGVFKDDKELTRLLSEWDEALAARAATQEGGE